MVQCKESACNAGYAETRQGFDPWIGKIPWSRRWQSAPIFLPGKFHEERSLTGYSPWSSKETDTAEHACSSCGLGASFSYFFPLPMTTSNYINYSDIFNVALITIKLYNMCLMVYS